LNEIEALKLRLRRERAARLEAESLLEQKSRELHDAVKGSQQLAEKLKNTVEVQTRELLSAQRVTKLGTFRWDTGEDQFQWSEGSRDVLGLAPSDAVASFAHLLALIHVDDRYLMRQLLGQLDDQDDGRRESPAETETSFRVLMSDGEIRWIKLVCEDSGPGVFMGAVQDVSDSVLAAKEVREARLELEQKLADLEQAQEELKVAHEEAQVANATKSRFIAMISHDIRTPINGMLGTLTLLAENELNRSQRALLDVAILSANTLRVLVNDVIDFARLETGQIRLEMADFNFRELVSQLVDFWSPLASSSDNSLEFSIDERVSGTLRGDPVRLGQILNNLLSNAIKFTKGGNIMLAVRSDESRTIVPGKQSLVIEVTDTGIGISTSEQVNLFKDFSQVPMEQGQDQEQFFDLSGSRRGAGLGLAICRALVEQMGGRISVMSSPSLGSTFSIRLALEEGLQSDAKEKPSALHPLLTVDGNVPHALVAEDVPANQLVSRMLLQSFGCHVDMANDGVEAVAAFKNRNYDFVLMDISMPRLDGIAATAQIRSLNTTVPIVGLTAFAFDDEKQRFLEAGMDEVVSKPVIREDLYKAVRDVLLAADARAGGLGEKNDAAVDLNVLQALTVGLSGEQVRTVVQQVTDDLKKYRRDAKTEAKRGNINGLARSCHAIKGLAASFGGKRLAELASLIEDSAQKEDFELAVANTMDRLDHLTDETVRELGEYLANPEARSDVRRA
jgi:signal transduction histidine kinase/DNA-binding response OmpR family regulator